MANFLKSKSKMIILIYAILISLTLLFALVFMTNYANVHVFYKVNSDNSVTFNSTSVLTVNSSTNAQLFKYFANLKDASNPVYQLLMKQNNNTGSNAFRTSGLAQIVYDFQTDMSAFNDQIIVYFCVTIILFACMMIASNHNRKVYYISNLVVGLVAPAAICGYSVVMLMKNLSLLSTFNKYQDLFRAVSYLQDENITAKEKNASVNDWQIILDNTKEVNATAFYFGIVLFVAIIVYSVLMIVYTIYRYKECSKRRAEIIERAAKKND